MATDLLTPLQDMQGITIRSDAPLSQYTRFALGGPASWVVDADNESAFVRAIDVVRGSGLPFTILGQGTNVIVSDDGYRGIVLRYTAARIEIVQGELRAQAGALLQTVVDTSIEAGLSGLHTMTGIPGWLGAAIYGNAGAYGHSISEFATCVRFFDGKQVQHLDNAACQFAYRHSVFKHNKDWVILDCVLRLPPGDPAQLAAEAAKILSTRNAKYPPEMKCAGSIFKNLLFAELPDAVQALIPTAVVREGKVPSAWFLEQVGAKGIRVGDVEVAPYHANLIYNRGSGRAQDLRTLISDLKKRVDDRFGLSLEEEVQYVGF